MWRFRCSSRRSFLNSLILVLVCKIYFSFDSTLISVFHVHDLEGPPPNPSQFFICRTLPLIPPSSSSVCPLLLPKNQSLFIPNQQIFLHHDRFLSRHATLPRDKTKKNLWCHHLSGSVSGRCSFSGLDIRLRLWCVAAVDGGFPKDFPGREKKNSLLEKKQKNWRERNKQL